MGGMQNTQNESSWIGLGHTDGSCFKLEVNEVKRRLPKGEETLPFYDLEGKLLTPDRLHRPDLLRPRVTDKLLIERVRMRVSQGRVPTIYRLDYELSPDEQLKHMELSDEVGVELMQAERKLLEEEIRILGE